MLSWIVCTCGINLSIALNMQMRSNFPHYIAVMAMTSWWRWNVKWLCDECITILLYPPAFGYMRRWTGSSCFSYYQNQWWFLLNYTPMKRPLWKNIKIDLFHWQNYSWSCRLYFAIIISWSSIWIICYFLSSIHVVVWKEWFSWMNDQAFRIGQFSRDLFWPIKRSVLYLLWL